MTPERETQLNPAVQRCPVCQDELHKRTDGKLVCLEKSCPEFKKEKWPVECESKEIIEARHQSVC